MKMAPPGGELSFWSALWIVFAIGCVYFGISTGATTYFMLAAAVGLPAVGMWFGIRWSGYILAAILVLTIALALFAFIVVDDTLSERGVRAVRIVAAGYFAWISFRWARAER